MKKVIIFGATGTVGAYTCLHLRELGYSIVAVGHRSSDNGFFSIYGIDYISVDVRSKIDFKKLPTENIDGIVHLCGLLPARMEGYEPQMYIDVNLTGTLNILEYAKQIHVRNFIYSQSISDVAYLCGSKNPIPSDAEPKFPLNNDHSVYSITKSAAVNLIKHYAEIIGYDYYILRFPNIYLYHPNPMYYVNGKKQWQGYRKLIHMAQHGEPISIWGNPDKVRDIVYVKDCTQIIEKCLSSGAPSGTYNVGTGIGTSIKEQVEKIVEIFSPSNLRSNISIDFSKPDTLEYVFDISKTEKYLGYVPQYGYIDYLIDFKKEMEKETFALLWGYNQDK